MRLPPKASRTRQRLSFLPETTALWYYIARFIRAQIKAENVWRQPRGIPFCHMPIDAAAYFTGEIDYGRDAKPAGTLDI